MPGSGHGDDLARRHALGVDTYDRYSGYTSSLVAVDVEATAQAFSRLFASSDLRRQMGEAGRRRAREIYDWAAIIPQYEALWAELAERRAKADSPAPTNKWPARADPFHIYARYPTRMLEPGTMLALADPDTATALERVARYRNLTIVRFAEIIMPTEQEIAAVLDALAEGPRPASDTVAAIPQERRTAVFRGLAWLLKLGVLKLVASS